MDFATGRCHRYKKDYGVEDEVFSAMMTNLQQKKMEELRDLLAQAERSFTVAYLVQR